MNIYCSKKTYQIIMFLGLIIVTGVFAYIIYEGSLSSTQKKIVINEVCNNNFTLVKDKNGNYSDYIELFNPGSEEISLEGYFLSDDEKQLQKYSLGGGNGCSPSKGLLCGLAGCIHTND